MVRSGAARSAASDIYHNNFENVHIACEDFKALNKLDSLNKMLVLLGQLHNASGAQYIYGTDSQPEIWLMSNGQIVMRELIADAESSNLVNVAVTLKKMFGELERSQLV